MGKRALITGSDERATLVAELLTVAGVEVVGEPSGQVDIYVQLPSTVSVSGDTVVQRVHSFLSNGLLARYGEVERILPSLAPDAVVLLVAGNLPGELSAPDDHLARLAPLRVLAHAIRADLAPARARVRVISAGRSEAEVVDLALSGRKDPDAELRVSVPVPDQAKSYEDWRTEVVGLVGIEA